MVEVMQKHILKLVCGYQGNQNGLALMLFKKIINPCCSSPLKPLSYDALRDLKGWWLDYKQWHTLVCPSSLHHHRHLFGSTPYWAVPVIPLSAITSKLSCGYVTPYSASLSREYTPVSLLFYTQVFTCHFKQLHLTSCDIFVKSIQEKPVIYVASLYMHGMLSECVYLFGSGIDRAITHSSSVSAKNTREGYLTEWEWCPAPDSNHWGCFLN